MTTKNRMEQLCEEGQVGGHPLRYLPETDSTNRVALEQGQKGAAAGMVIVAGQQTEGRGRLGKKWLSSPDSSLSFSMILRPRLAWSELAKITLASGLAVAEALQPLCRDQVMLKWPNDIVIGGRKCGGILAEADLSQAESPLVVLGIGLNLRRPREGYPAEIAERAGALADQSGEDIDAGSLLESLVRHLDRVVVELEQQGWPAIRARWQQRDITLGQKLTWVTAGGELITGVSQGIDAEGLLFIRDEQGMLHEVLSGDVQLLSR